MSPVPILSKELDPTTFRDHYYLKEDLVRFCRENGLQTTGGKIDLTERISHYLDTGEHMVTKGSKKRPSDEEVTKDTLIGDNYVYSEKHRAFFKGYLGDGFKFNVRFQRWLKSNGDKTHDDAIKAYKNIAEERTETVIDRQFEYNAYIRAFFAANKGRTLNDAIKCWKYKKDQRGHNKYEQSDTIVLTQEYDDE